MSNSPSPWKALSVASMIGIDIGVCTVIGFWLGRKMDEWMGTAPLWLVIGVLTGVTAGILSMIPVVKKYLGD